MTTRPTISKALRALVWNTYIGQSVGATDCVCCHTTITQLSYECGHVIAFSKGGATTVENLYPICHNCNCSMGTRDYRQFLKDITGKVVSGLPKGAMDPNWKPKSAEKVKETKSTVKGTEKGKPKVPDDKGKDKSKIKSATKANHPESKPKAGAPVPKPTKPKKDTVGQGKVAPSKPKSTGVAPKAPKPAKPPTEKSKPKVATKK